MSYYSAVRFFETRCISISRAIFLRHSASNDGVSLKFELRVVQGHGPPLIWAKPPGHHYRAPKSPIFF